MIVLNHRQLLKLASQYNIELSTHKEPHQLVLRWLVEIKKEQWELVNKILQTTNAKFIQIDNRTFNVSAIRQVYKKPYATEIPYETTIIENEITPEQRKRNQEALDELREQLKNNLLIK